MSQVMKNSSEARRTGRRVLLFFGIAFVLLCLSNVLPSQGASAEPIENLEKKSANLPVDSRICPGTGLTIQVGSVGMQPTVMNVQVSTNGDVTLSHLLKKPIACNGLTCEAFKQKLIKAYSVFYRQPMVTVELSPSKTAFDVLKEKAQGGDVAAMCEIAQHYRLGLETEKNNELAAEWTQKAASNGFVRAVGLCHWFGYGVKSNAVEAVKWFRKAAEQGDAEAMYDLVRCYEKGLGVEKDEKEAARWRKKAKNTQDSSESSGRKKVCDFVREYLGVEFGDPIEKHSNVSGLQASQSDTNECLEINIQPVKRFEGLDRATASFRSGKLCKVSMFAVYDEKWPTNSVAEQIEKVLSKVEEALGGRFLARDQIEKIRFLRTKGMTSTTRIMPVGSFRVVSSVSGRKHTVEIMGFADRPQRMPIGVKNHAVKEVCSGSLAAHRRKQQDAPPVTVKGQEGRTDGDSVMDPPTEDEKAEMRQKDQKIREALKRLQKDVDEGKLKDVGSEKD